MALVPHRVGRAICVVLAGACLGVPKAAARADGAFARMPAGSDRTRPVGSSATGSAAAAHETAGSEVRYDIVFDGLAAPLVAAHLHSGDAAAADGDGPVILGFGNVPTALSGRFGGAATQARIETVPVAIATGLDSLGQILGPGLPDGLQVDLHDADFPRGGIRGDLVAAVGSISLPGTSALMGIALLGLGLAMRRGTRSKERGDPGRGDSS